MLYRCKNNIDSYEIGRMVPYFWKKFYFNRRKREFSTFDGDRKTNLQSEWI